MAQARRNVMVQAQAVAWPSPSALHHEFQEIQAGLEGMTQVPGLLGSSTRHLVTMLETHFLRQEALVLPPLGLLAPLSRGAVSREMSAIVPIADRLRSEMPGLLDELMAIARAFDEVATLARLADRPELARITRQIQTYALLREQVIYPAALMAGDAVRCHLERQPGR
jgi:hypothetical protein